MGFEVYAGVVEDTASSSATLGQSVRSAEFGIRMEM
jgi:hypothetical protein